MSRVSIECSRSSQTGLFELALMQLLNGSDGKGVTLGWANSGTA